MSFLGQFNFGYPVISQNLISTIPDNAVLPLSIGSSLKGNILGTTFADLKAQIVPKFINSNILYGENLPSIASLNGGSNNVIIGTNIGPLSGTPQHNIIFGNGVFSYASGVYNIAIGEYAFNGSNGMGSNIGIGAGVLQSSSNVNQSIVIGDYAGAVNDGDYNIILGGSAGRILGNGSNYNIFIGRESGFANNKNGCANNVALGRVTLYNVTTGIKNVVLGDGAGITLTIGSGNTIIGADAGTNATNVFNSVVIGRNAQATADNQFVVGSSSYAAGQTTPETIVPNTTWRVRINGVNYKIPLLAI